MIYTIEDWTSKGYSDTMNALSLEKRAAGKVKWSHVREALQLASIPLSVWGAAEMLKQRKTQQSEMKLLRRMQGQALSSRKRRR